MIRQTALGPTRFAQLRVLVKLVTSEAVTLGGHRPGKIYGTLTCRTGKRMKPENRVFFRNETEAIAQGFRPCAVCLPGAYKAWRKG
ncbi:metal-binding protein [Spirosoma sp. HMF4905]|uniref:Metal-binding protein n=1 Tax=Spirosoma arboris TaxID=2682092 RepID=A0A7K1SCE6_9BACT|nr:Ada metal-binding domain-containing protein [Spirosoma arboris]MVM31441.1 metal-binding protein [Spirosoma arboris]